MIKKPLLASNDIVDTSTVKYPVMVSRKYDGIRALFPGNVGIVSRSYKPIKNRYIKELLDSIIPDGIDGEIVAGTFNESQSGIMSSKGQPEFTYMVFDYVKDDNTTPFHVRYEQLKNLNIFEHNFIELVEQYTVSNVEELMKYEQQFIDEGYEGLMIRDINGIYKFGRSTLKQGMLLKVKRFTDSDGVIIGFEEKMHNNNPATKDAFGRTKRSTHKANMIPANTLGSFRVECDGVEFGVGPAMTAIEAQKIWDDRENYIGRLIKFKHQESGAGEKARFGTFVGFRDMDDIS